MEWKISLDGLDAFAPIFWRAAGGARVFAFHGQMGAGKTTTIAALCRFKGVADSLSSPSFSIINEYEYMEQGARMKIFHIDLYRLEGEEEIAATGVEDCVTSGATCFVEWPQKAPYLFDENTLHILIEPVSEKERRVQLLTHSAFAVNSFAEQS
jgi:tRNA threonylcarbamoyladenosine biosynthesis protein TsaE